MIFEEVFKELGLTDPWTREPITPEELIGILKDDVVLAVERPGSWEGSNMLDVLRCHGFFKDW
jgi:hypothetical protein